MKKICICKVLDFVFFFAQLMRKIIKIINLKIFYEIKLE